MKTLLLLLLISLSIQSFSQSKNFIDQPYLEVTASADTLVIPDKIHLTILLNEKDHRNKRSTEEMEKNMLKVLNTFNIDIEKNLSVMDYNSEFKKYFLSNKKILKSKNYLLILSNAEEVGDIIAALENEDISNVMITRTEYSKAEELILQLKSNAVYKAKQYAERLVKPLDQTIGKAVYISDLSSPSSYRQLEGKVTGIRIRGVSSLYESEQSDSILVDFEKMKISSEVSVKFLIE